MTLINYTKIPIKENNDLLVKIEDGLFVVQPEYFIRGISTSDEIFLRGNVVELLKKVSKNIRPYKLKIWDGFRPLEIQQKLHDNIMAQFRTENPEWDEDRLYIEAGKYITPADEEGRIPPHFTGGSVDLTMVDENNEELDMGTDFDYFGIKASYNFKDLPKKVLENRKFLRDAMIDADFRPDNEEWWHFDYGNQLWAFDLNKNYAVYGSGQLSHKV